MGMESEFTTSDLYYAAYLKVAGVPLLGTRREGSRVVFIFEQTPLLSDLKRDFYNRNGKVSALTFCDELKALKSLTFSS